MNIKKRLKLRHNTNPPLSFQHKEVHYQISLIYFVLQNILYKQYINGQKVTYSDGDGVVIVVN